MTCMAYHGIGAYVGQTNPMSLRHMLITALKGVELCVSERAIGAFGAVLEGTVRTAFSRDVWSFVENGIRVAGIDNSSDYDSFDDDSFDDGKCYIPYGWVDESDDGVSGKQYEPSFVPVETLPGVKELSAPKNQRELEDWLYTNHDPEGHTEAWMCATALRALWVKSWAPEATKKAARILANSRGVPLFVVSGSKDKIWNLLDDVERWGDKYPQHDYSKPEVMRNNAFRDFFEEREAA